MKILLFVQVDTLYLFIFRKKNEDKLAIDNMNRVHCVIDSSLNTHEAH